MSVKDLVRNELKQRVQVSSTRQRYVDPPNMISLAAGDPNFLLPDYIADAISAAIKGGCNHYCFGDEAELKEAISNYYSKYGYKAPPNLITITSGGNPSLNQAYAAILNAGDENITPDPSYGGGGGMMRYLSVKNVHAPMKKVNGLFRIDLEALKKAITPKTKSLYLDNPGNPSGAVFTKEELKGIADLAIDHNFFVVSDETYSEYVWDGHKHECLIAIPGMENRTLVCMAMTKMYSWAGMRTGWVITGPELAPYVASAPSGSVSWPIQKGAVKALTEGYEYVETIKKEYEERLDYATKRLNELPGIKCTKPEGAFYLFPDISGTGMTSQEFGEKLREEEAIRISGSMYGPGNAKGHIRLSMIVPLSYQKTPSWYEVTKDKTLESAMDRIEKFVKRHVK
ncbi:aminotransferase class I/II-fold pyridoxal phosphate-dependent enzyme [Candidatus Bathyarchaeota archaeon]|nr:aminotransferase class I/II-fold pyridoxal phosphate-dependent enzyme [Candidatus Bathyarchaeota archaeon]